MQTKFVNRERFFWFSRSF